REGGQGGAVGSGDRPEVAERVVGPTRVAGHGVQGNRAALEAAGRHREVGDGRRHVAHGNGRCAGGGAAVSVADGQADTEVAAVSRGEGGRGAREGGQGGAVGSG